MVVIRQIVFYENTENIFLSAEHNSKIQCSNDLGLIDIRQSLRKNENFC